MKIVQNMIITILFVFVCIFYPDYIMLEELCRYIDNEGVTLNEESDLKSWKDIRKVEAEDLVISSKIYEYINEYWR